jgi:2-dehydro-3-deoxy-D-pentonate aldolase
MQIRGIIPPVVTPMKPNEDIDLPRLKQHIDWQLSNTDYSPILIAW